MTEHAATRSPTPSSDAPTCGALALARPLIERQLQVLGELAEVGLEVARAIARQANGTSAETVVQGDLALAYARVSRAVRLTIALQSKLIEDLQALERDTAMQSLRAEADVEHAQWSVDHNHKARIECVVRRVIKAEHADEETYGEMIGETGERLDDDTLYRDVLTRPISEVVALICRDLGLSPDWPRLAQEAWAQEEIESGKVGGPLAGRTGWTAESRPPPTAAPDPFLNTVHPGACRDERNE